MNPRSVFYNSRKLTLPLVFTQALAGVAWVGQARGEQRAAPSTPTADSRALSAADAPLADSPAAEPPAAEPLKPHVDSVSGEQLSVAELAARGAELYHARQYRSAIDFYERAFALDADPNLVFNLARCHEKLGDVTTAIRRYEEYIAMPGAETEGRLRAQSALDELRRLEAGAPERQPKATPTNAAKPGSGSRGGAISLTPSHGRAEANKNGDPPSVWPWVSFGAGIVGVGAGTFLYVSGHREHQLLTEVDNYSLTGGVYDLTRAEAERRRAWGDDRKLWGVVAASTGGALLVTSLVLFLVNGNERQERGVAFDVVPNVGGATFNLTGSL